MDFHRSGSSFLGKSQLLISFCYSADYFFLSVSFFLLKYSSGVKLTATLFFC